MVVLWSQEAWKLGISAEGQMLFNLSLKAVKPFVQINRQSLKGKVSV